MAITYKRGEGLELANKTAFMINEKMFKNSALWEYMSILPHTPVSVHGNYTRCTAFYGADLVAVVTINSPQEWAYEITTCMNTTDDEHDLLLKELKLPGGTIKLTRRWDTTHIQFLCTWGAITTETATRRFCNSLGMAILAQLISRTYPKKDVA